jgi:hypothetical protein
MFEIHKKFSLYLNFAKRGIKLKFQVENYKKVFKRD